MHEAKHIIIATGGRSRELPNLPMDGKKVVGYREAMVLPEQPKSMIVVGSGAIGVEFAYVYNSMGTKVTIVEFMPRIVPVEDEDISKELEKIYKKKGIAIMTNASVESVDTKGAGVKASVKMQDGSMQTLEADILLSAVGVVANIENIGLEALGIAVEKGKIVVDKYGKTNVDGFLRHWRLYTWPGAGARGFQGSHYLRGSNCECRRQVRPQARADRLWQRTGLYLLLAGNCFSRHDRKAGEGSRP